MMYSPSYQTVVNEWTLKPTSFIIKRVKRKKTTRKAYLVLVVLVN